MLRGFESDQIGVRRHLTRATLEKEAADPQILGAKLDDPVKQVNVGLITGLVLGSPEFQKR